MDMKLLYKSVAAFSLEGKIICSRNNLMKRELEFRDSGEFEMVRAVVVLESSLSNKPIQYLLIIICK